MSRHHAVVDVNAGTFASFYYKNIKDFETPTKDHMVDFGQEDTYTVNAFDVSNYRIVSSPTCVVEAASHANVYKLRRINRARVNADGLCHCHYLP